LAAVIVIAAFAEDFFHMVHKNMSPHIPWKHLGSGRKPEKVHCTELLHTLYTPVDRY
jgi:hypothetical protein